MTRAGPRHGTGRAKGGRGRPVAAPAPGSLLDLATGLLARVLAFEQPMDRVVGEVLHGERSLGSRDRRLLGELAYAVVRELAWWRHLASTAGGPEPEARRLAMLAWPGDEPALQRLLQPAEAAWLARARTAAAADRPPALRHNLPDWLASRLEVQLGAGFDAFADAMLRPATLCLRVNRLKATLPEAIARLADDGIVARPGGLSPVALRVEGRPPLQGSAAYRDGWVEVQDEGSQLLALALGARRQDTVVDYCAGAGGKTLALGAQMRGGGRLYAFDSSAGRLAALAPRAERAGLAGVHAVQITGAQDERLQRLAGKCDRVLVDAPCSGLGTLRREPDLKWRHHASDIAAFARIQREILESAWRLVKPGGRLVYATCSPLAEEDEAVADAFEQARAGRTRLPMAEVLATAQVPDPSRLVEGRALRLWPQRDDTDAYFAAAWERTA